MMRLFRTLLRVLVPVPGAPFFRVAVVLVLLSARASFAQTLGYEPFLDWKGWARIDLEERTGLASSWDRTGGPIDANQYESPPGVINGDLDTVAATIRGPGIIQRFWMPHRAASGSFAIRMFFDGEATPRIDTTSDQILDGLFQYFAAPLVTTCAGGQVSYDPIAFRDSVRIETENHANEWHWYQYSYRLLPPGTPVSSHDGTLDAPGQTARAQVAAMFTNVGQHPAGPSGTSTTVATSPTVVPAGQGIVLADLAGPGLVCRLNVRMNGATDADLDSLRLRVSYNDAPDLEIDCPVSGFFGAGHGRALYRSLPVGTDSPDGFYCYWPMPFEIAVRIELFNESASPIAVDSAVVEHEPLVAWEEDLGYLHAEHRATVRQVGQILHELAGVAGRGHYVGNFLFADHDYDTHFFLEGDDILVIDGVDTLNGTGLEDAYNGGFYYNWVPDPMDEPEGPSPPFAIRPLHGILHVDRTASPPYARADQYRWMIADRVRFTSEISVNQEIDNTWAGSRWSSVAFWYQYHPPFSTTGAPRRASAPSLELRANEPNPFATSTRIRFTLPSRGDVVLEVVDVAGRRVETLIDGPRPAGAHETSWTPGSLPNGVYFLRLRSGDVVTSRKLVLAR